MYLDANGKNIDTDAVCVIIKLISAVTMTLIRAGCIEAQLIAVSTDARVVSTFVNVVT